jgi:hypothetical protein
MSLDFCLYYDVPDAPEGTEHEVADFNVTEGVIRGDLVAFKPPTGDGILARPRSLVGRQPPNKGT